MRPKLSLRLPIRGITLVTATMKMDIVQAAQTTSVPKSLMKLGKATATAVLSMEYMNRLKPAAAKIKYRCIFGTVLPAETRSRNSAG